MILVKSFSSYIEGIHYKSAQLTQLFHIFTGHDLNKCFIIFTPDLLSGKSVGCNLRDHVPWNVIWYLAVPHAQHSGIISVDWWFSVVPAVDKL